MKMNEVTEVGAGGGEVVGADLAGGEGVVVGGGVGEPAGAAPRRARGVEAADPDPATAIAADRTVADRHPQLRGVDDPGATLWETVEWSIRTL